MLSLSGIVRVLPDSVKTQCTKNPGNVPGADSVQLCYAAGCLTGG